MTRHRLKLYITGQTPRTDTTVRMLREVCEEQLQGEYELEVIDVLENPRLAEEAKILATPTLIRELPPPIQRIIGDWSEVDRAILGLALQRGADKPEDSTGGSQ